MGSIKVLSEQLASQIAAGEVVERPSSVVKELVENALDAGARSVNVDIRGGGRQLIQVADDGAGIPADDVATAFLRHATSKLNSAEDLSAIGTLGFRGEALAAIAAVSQVTLISRPADTQKGVRLLLEGGKIKSRETAGAPQGTVIAVENLFYNMPARLKFLKSVTREKRLIDEYVTRYALAYPHVRFRLTHDGRITFQSSGAGGLMDVLTAVHGPETARQLLPIAGGEEDEPAASPTAIRVSGYVGPPSLHWSSRNHITLFVNRRWIKDSQLTYAVIQAYHTLLPAGRYPLAIIFVEMPFAEVDVNVHPAKTEVRFRDANAVFGAIQRAARRALLEHSPVRGLTQFASGETGEYAGWGGRLERGAFSQRDEHSEQGDLALNWQTPAAAPGDEPEKAGRPILAGGQLPIMRLVGQVGAAYIITEGPDGLFLIDQHAAHERILYEQFLAQWEADGQMAAQGLVAGEAVQFSPSQTSLLEEHLALLGQLGFEIEPFGPNSFMIRSIPALLAKLEPARALAAVVEELENESKPLQEEIEAQIIRRVCKSGAVKAGQTLSASEMEAMIRQLEQCQNPHTCPHGRPTMIHLSVTQLAREFGRI